MESRKGFTEAEITRALARVLSTDAPQVVLGIGDDAALVEPGAHLVVLTVDMLVEGVDFARDLVSPRDLGYRSLVVNVSDVAAMGGSPRYGLVALGLPVDVEASWVIELYGGLKEASDDYAMAIVGGDLSRADQVVISVTVTGEVAKGGAVARSGATVGDRIVVTGRLGAAAGGLRLMQAPAKSIRSVIGTPWARDLLAAHARPVARVGEGQTLARAGATAMIDVSDGLAKDLGRLCRASGVAAEVKLSRVPVASGLDGLARVLSVDPLELALAGGEDFELLATLPADVVEETAGAINERFGTALTEIGTIVKGDGLTAVDPDGTRRPLPESGWDHFRS